MGEIDGSSVHAQVSSVYPLAVLKTICFSPHRLHPLTFCVALDYVRSFAGLLVVTNRQVACSIDLNHAFLFASGALLTASLLHLIPEAMEVSAQASCRSTPPVRSTRGT